MQVLNSDIFAAQSRINVKSGVSGSILGQIKAFAPSSTIKIGKDFYIIERHFSGERDIREAIFEAMKNEAFCAP